MGRSPLLLLAVLTLAACETSQSSGNCVSVDTAHLARPSNSAGMTMICNPQEISAEYRDQYFPNDASGN